MTRILSELLGAREPAFRMGVRQLERASGQPSEDIRLTTEVASEVRAKIRELNLDPHDTTGEELYQALMERVRRDNQTLESLLGEGGTEANLMPRIERLVNSLQVPKDVFALRTVAAKKLLKNHPPKRAMKQLGYRSMESLLKHEPVCALFAAARMCESPAWHKTMLGSYKKLLPSDFESRPATLLAPTHERWEKLAKDYVAKHQHNILTFRELGTVVLLPLSGKLVQGAPLAATLLTLQALNDMRATSTYLKLHQVRPDFGKVVADVAVQDPMTETKLEGVKLPWKLVHHFFASKPDAYSADIFEPHVQPEDLQYEPVENSLARLHPTFEFWQNAAHLGMHHHGKAISLHPIDAVLNFCNKIPFERRLTHHFRTHLWHELMLRYMKQTNLEQRVREQLGDELVEPAAIA